MGQYPLKFQPVFQRRLWGGQKLRAILGKPVGTELEREAIGESWEVADLPAGTVGVDSAGAAADGSLSSVIANGPLAGKMLHDFWGAARAGSSYFPLLIKYLDARQDLSVQVHPNGAYAKAHPGAHLKSEAWYILQADAGAKIYKGLKAGVTREQFAAALERGDVAGLLNAVPVRAGDCHYLESGTVHALGAGILAAEVQTPSDTTFRVFDWNRLGPDGKPRKLHVKEALACIDFGPAKGPAPIGAASSENATRLAECDYFTIDRVALGIGREMAIVPGMAIWMILEGQGVVQGDGIPPTAFARGDTLLLPPGLVAPRVKTIAQATWLEARLPERKA
jgi:mannose-6-phosphate isomerase